MQEWVGERNHSSSVIKTFTEKHISIFREIKDEKKISFIFSPLVNVTGTWQNTLQWRYSFRGLKCQRDLQYNEKRQQCWFPCLTDPNAAQIRGATKSRFLACVRGETYLGLRGPANRLRKAPWIISCVSVLWELPLMKSPTRCGPA